MTWSARITDNAGQVKGKDYHACQSCKHGQYDHETGNTSGGSTKIQPCFLPKIANNIGSLLTSVDVDANGHMASGSAELRCNGYEPEPVE